MHGALTGELEGESDSSIMEGSPSRIWTRVSILGPMWFYMTDLLPVSYVKTES